MEEIGDLLFACANLARHAGVDAEQALRRAGARFERRFREMERRLSAEGRHPAEVEMGVLDRLWEKVKEDDK